MQTRVRARADRALGRDREVGCILGHAATTQHCDAVEDNRVPQEIQKFTSGICAVGCAVIVYDQRAVAVINFQAAVRTTAHTAVGTSWHRRKAVLPRRVADPLGIWRQPAYGPPSEAVGLQPGPHFAHEPPRDRASSWTDRPFRHCLVPATSLLWLGHGQHGARGSVAAFDIPRRRRNHVY
jgi:hypothetical protein